MKPLRVLVPLDGSPLAEAVLPLVRALEPSEVTLVRVLDHRHLASAPQEPREHAASAERDLGFTAASLGRAGLGAIVPIIREGHAAEEILAVARKVDADAIAMTTHGRSGFDRLVLGSVAEKVIRAAPVPVLVLRAAEPAPAEARTAPLFERVLVASDGSDMSLRALDALAAIDARRASRPRIFGVVETYGGPKAIPEAMTHDVMVEYQRLRREGLREDLARAVARARELGFEAEAEVAVGLPAATILERAESLGATLIALATHGRSGPSRWALGSVTEKVLRAATMPLLICR